MQFFTPERYAALQSDEFEEQAHADWESQLKLYEQRLRAIDGKLPASVKEFMRTCFLHDAEWDQWFDPNDKSSRVQLVIRQPDYGRWFVLRYRLPGTQRLCVHHHVHVAAGLNPVAEPEWLYDEWEITHERYEQPWFTHSILLSNGSEYRITFTEFEFVFADFAPTPNTARHT